MSVWGTTNNTFGHTCCLSGRLKAYAAEMVYGQPFRLPGETLTPSCPKTVHRTSGSTSAPVSGTHWRTNTLCFLKTFLCTNEPPYTGPYPVISRARKTAVIHVRSSDVTFSVDRLKPLLHHRWGWVHRFTILTCCRQPLTSVWPLACC